MFKLIVIAIVSIVVTVAACFMIVKSHDTGLVEHHSEMIKEHQAILDSVESMKIMIEETRNKAAENGFKLDKILEIAENSRKMEN